MWSRTSFAWALPAAALALVFACTGDDPDLTASPADSGTDTGATGDTGAGGETGAGDAGTKCRSEDPFGPGNLLDGVNNGENVFHPRLSADELEIFYQRGQNQIMRSTRGSRDLPFGNGVQIPLPEAAVSAYDPAISGNTLALYVSLNQRIARMSRPVRTAPFGSPETLELGADGGFSDSDPHVLANESALYFARLDPAVGATRVWRTQGDGDGGFAQPTLVDFADAAVGNPAVSEDELEIYVQSGDAGIQRSVRASTGEAFSALVPVEDLNSQSLGGGNTRPGWLSPDRCRMYFASGTTLSLIYLAERKPR